MKKLISVCEICNLEKCDGILYEIKIKKGHNFYDNIILCKNSRDIIKENGKLYYHWVMGHGIEDYYELIEFKEQIKYTDKYGRKFKKCIKI